MPGKRKYIIILRKKILRANKNFTIQIIYLAKLHAYNYKVYDACTNSYF